jgi:hypothetical protein
MLQVLLNHKFAMIVLFVVLIVGLLFFKKYKCQKKVTFNEGYNKTVEQYTSSLSDKFIPSEQFDAAKEGYVFKNDKLGIGYYLDNK